MDRRDKEQQHLDDHHQDLLHEEALLNCEHEDYTITDIVNKRTLGLQGEKLKDPMLEVEIICEFCGKSNIGEIEESLVEKWIMDPSWSHLLEWLNQNTDAVTKQYDEWE